MRILINDKMQFASGVPAEIISPALSDRYNTAVTFTATFDDAEVVNCIGIGYTDATEIEIRNDNPFDAAVINLPLESDALDVSGNGNDGTATDITWTGGVANFNGTSSKIVLSLSIPNLTGYSISFKFKRNGKPAATEYLLSNIVDASNRTVLCIDSASGKLYFHNRVSAVGSEFPTNNNLCDNIEHNVIITIINSTQFTFTIDGITESIKTLSVALVSFVSPILRIGVQVTTNYFTGTMSKLYIFNRTSTDAERTSIYNGDMLQTLTLTPRTDVTRKYNNGLYLLNEISTSKFTITHNGNYIGRIGIGEYRTLGTAPSKEIGFYTTTESRETLSGQTIPGAGGYYGRRFVADVRYKFTEEIYNDLETAYQTQIQRSFPYFLLLDDEQHKVPDTMLHFYAASDKPLSLLQSSSYKFLYSYKFNFEERF